jgi:glycosyltransferase 2 family protein
MAPRASRTARYLRTAVCLAAFGALFAVVDVRAVVHALADADPLWVACAIAANFAARLLAAERNLSISRALDLPLRRSHTIGTLFIANFWSLLLPGISAGGVATVYEYRRHGAQAHSSLGVLGASRVLEVFAFATLSLAGLAFAVQTAPTDLRRALFAGVALIATLAVLAVVSMRLLPPPVTKEGGSLVSRAWRFVLGVAAAVRQLRTADYLRGIAIAAAQGLCDALIVLCFARALGLGIGFADCLWVNGLSYFTILLPISVAGLGMREVAIVTALTPLGVPRSLALALALLMLAATLLNALVGAVLQIWRYGNGSRRVASSA